MRGFALPKLSLILITLIMVACAGSKINVIPAYSAKQLWDSEQGLVVARVINASPYPLPYNYLTLAPKDVFETKENKFQRIANLKTIGDKTSLFASGLKPGSYSLSDLYSYRNYGNYYYQNFGSVEASFGTFVVEAGKVTDLGTLIYYRKPDGDVYYDVVNRKTDEGLTLDLIKKELPGVAAKIDFNRPLSWSQDENSDERHDQYLNMAQNPINYNRAYPLADGGWKFTAPLGMLISRNASGEWGLEAVETDYELEFFSQNQGGDQLVSSEAKMFYLKAVGSDSWKSSAAPEVDTRFNQDDKEFSLAALKLLDDGSFVALYRNDYFLLLRHKPQGDHQWSTRMVYSQGLQWLNIDAYVQKQEKIAAALAQKKTNKRVKRKKKVGNFSIRSHRGDFYIAADKALYRLSTEDFQAEAINKDFSVEGLDQSGLDQITIHRSSIWDGSVTTEYSLDDGNSWNSYNKNLDRCPESPAPDSNSKCSDGKRRFQSYRHASLPVFYQDGTAYSIFTKVDINFWNSRRTSTKLMVRSVDGGKTWLEVKDVELPKHCHRMIKGVGSEILLSCSSTTGQFYHTDKNKIEWELDYEPSSF